MNIIIVIENIFNTLTMEEGREGKRMLEQGNNFTSLCDIEDIIALQDEAKPQDNITNK